MEMGFFGVQLRIVDIGKVDDVQNLEVRKTRQETRESGACCLAEPIVAVGRVAREGEVFDFLGVELEDLLGAIHVHAEGPTRDLPCQLRELGFDASILLSKGEFVREDVRFGQESVSSAGVDVSGDRP